MKMFAKHFTQEIGSSSLTAFNFFICSAINLGGDVLCKIRIIYIWAMYFVVSLNTIIGPPSDLFCPRDLLVNPKHYFVCAWMDEFIHPCLFYLRHRLMEQLNIYTWKRWSTHCWLILTALHFLWPKEVISSAQVLLCVCMHACIFPWVIGVKILLDQYIQAKKSQLDWNRQEMRVVDKLTDCTFVWLCGEDHKYFWVALMISQQILNHCFTKLVIFFIWEFPLSIRISLVIIFIFIYDL